MRNRNKDIYTPIPECSNRESQHYKSKAAEMPDKGIRAWNKTKTIPERSNRESQPCKKVVETPDKSTRGWVTTETPESCGRQLWGWCNRGFTLIELLVVVLMVGILVAIAIPQYQKATDKARFTQMIITGRSIKNAQEAYYMANATYATKKDLLDVEIPTNLTVTLQACSSGTPYAAYITWSKLPGVLLINSYNKQCKGKGSWSDRTACYARDGNDRANSLCASWTGNTKKSQADENGYYTYYL